MNGIAEVADIEAEADQLCSLIESHAEGLAAARLGRAFRLGNVSFRLHAKDRNTIYRVSARFDWFLKLPRSGDARLMARERLGANIISEVLASHPGYGGARVIRVGAAPPYVLAAAIPGTPLNRVLVTESWLPGRDAALRLEQAFATLGTLLATLHANARLEPNAPEPTKRPFDSLRKRSDQITSPEPISDAIARWCDTHGRTDPVKTFVHGNLRLDNVLRAGTRVGFLDFEHCGAGSLYQDLSRPVSQLLLVQAVAAFPFRRAIRSLRAFLTEYRRIQSYEIEPLNDYVTVRLSTYYLEGLDGGVLGRRIGGLPVVKSRLGRLTMGVLRDGLESVVPDLPA